ncbi:DUF6152 family protein [Aphanothece stagnina]|uniref:DUF6152 family protein n=1 Tax=Aphanothece stagnina TaxID=1004305 RepID=UPI00398F25AD
MSLTRRGVLTLAAGLAAGPALAHHGWRWTGDAAEVSGRIVQAQLGHPHTVLKLDVGGEIWLIEVGQPWRYARTGLTDTLLVEGTEIRARGLLSSDPGQRVIKAERIVVAGASFDLRPGSQ